MKGGSHINTWWTDRQWPVWFGSDFYWLLIGDWFKCPKCPQCKHYSYYFEASLSWCNVLLINHPIFMSLRAELIHSAHQMTAFNETPLMKRLDGTKKIAQFRPVLHRSNEWLTLTATAAAQTVKSPSYDWPPAPCWWRWCDFLTAERPNTVESVLPRLLLCFPCPPSGGVLSPPNVYCLVVNAPCGTETLQADGQVTWGAPGPGKKTFPSRREWMWLVRPQLSACVQLEQ